MQQPVIASRYRLERLIGRGASGDVFRGTDLRTNAPVAVKISAPAVRGAPGLGEPSPPPRGQGNLGAARRFLGSSVATDGPAAADGPMAREIEAARRLHHPGIAEVLDAGHSDGRSWLVMRLAKGAPLSRYVQPSRLLPEPLVLRLGARIAQALAHAHSQGVVHRDLKPSNVMVDLPSAQVTLLDFGVARIEDSQATRTGMTLGTPSYMAPEQLAGSPASPASDAYALGVLLFEMLTGRRPHLGATLGELLRAMAGSPAADLHSLRPDLPRDVAAAVQQALAAAPAQRPADLTLYSARLEALANGL